MTERWRIWGVKKKKKKKTVNSLIMVNIIQVVITLESLLP